MSPFSSSVAQHRCMRDSRKNYRLRVERTQPKRNSILCCHVFKKVCANSTPIGIDPCKMAVADAMGAPERASEFNIRPTTRKLESIHSRASIANPAYVRAYPPRKSEASPLLRLRGDLKSLHPVDFDQPEAYGAKSLPYLRP